MPFQIYPTFISLTVELMEVQAPRFQFMAGAQIAQKPLKLTYIHAQKRNTTLLEGSLSLDARNKVTGAYSFNTHKGSLKYTYVHGSGTTLEPSYDFGTEAWHFTAFKKVSQHDTARCGFDAHHNTVGLEWTRDSKEYGQFKVCLKIIRFMSRFRSPATLYLKEEEWGLF